MGWKAGWFPLPCLRSCMLVLLVYWDHRGIRKSVDKLGDRSHVDMWTYELNTSSLDTTLLYHQYTSRGERYGTYLSCGSLGVLSIAMRLGDLAIVSRISEDQASNSSSFLCR
jgi:hypothetical protein